jgi:phage-related protein
MKVKFFQTARGAYPVRDFIDGLEKITQAKVAKYIELLINYGPYLRPPYIKKMQNKLYELRIPGKIAVRIFYAVYDNEYYLLHAFKKKSNKTPRNELKIALDRLKEII